MRWTAFTVWIGLALTVLVAQPLFAQPAESDPAPPSSGGAAPADSESLRSPRAAMQTFLTACHRGDYTAAAAALDFSQIQDPPGAEQRARYAEMLKEVIDRVGFVDYAQISDNPDADTYYFPQDDPHDPLAIARDSHGVWQFRGDVVARIPKLYEQFKDRPKIVTSTPWYRRMTPIGNEAWRIAMLFVSLFLAYVVGRLFRYGLATTAASLEKRHRQFTAVTLGAVARSVVPLALVFGLKLGVAFLLLKPAVSEILATVISVLFAVALAYVANCLVDLVDAWLRGLSAATESKLDDMLVPMVRTCLRGTIVVLALVQIATILSDKPVTSIIAGLGVGGLAIGLAAQDTIKNFFGSLMIFSDQPFELGDRIQFGDQDGPVERVGFRSTSIRTLDGHVVTIPNGELANMTIRNVSKRPNIRRIMNLTVTYDTPPEKLRRAVEIVRELLADHEGMNPEMPPRVFFNEFADVALNIFAIYWYHPPDWWNYCEFSERLNFEILTRFNDEGIEFAFPTQTLFLAGDPNRPLPAIRLQGGDAAAG